METKNLVLAIVLSCLIFLGWNFLSVQMGWVPAKPPASAHNASAPAGAAPAAAVPAGGGVAGDPTAGSVSASPAFTPTAGRDVTVETPLYKAVFNSQGGVLREFQLKDYRQHLAPNSDLVSLVSSLSAGKAPFGLIVDGRETWTDTSWALEGGDLKLGAQESGTLRFISEQNGVYLVRELIFDGRNYTITEKTRFSASTPKAVRMGYSFAAPILSLEERPPLLSRLRFMIFGGDLPVVGESQYNTTRAAWLQDGSFKEDHAGSDLAKGVVLEGKVSWMSVMNNYFMGAVSMAGDNAIGKATFDDGIYRVVIGKSGVTFGPGQDSVVECSWFMGPKDRNVLADTPNQLSLSLDYGMFTVLAKPLVMLLDFFHKFVGNYGIAIILLTIVIKAVFWPLSQKSYKSMEQMKKLQPMMAKIREKHADDKEAMNREIMQLYKTYKVNPAGGCLPILVQIPVFFGLYQALLNSIELRHASFIAHLPFTDKIWLADLAAQDPYFITPLVMGATMFLQQKMSPPPGDPTQAKVMLLMPFIFTVLFINFPAGLVVYWLVNNVISIAQQWFTMRKKTA